MRFLHILHPDYLQRFLYLSSDPPALNLSSPSHFISISIVAESCLLNQSQDSYSIQRNADTYATSTLESCHQYNSILDISCFLLHSSTLSKTNKIKERKDPLKEAKIWQFLAVTHFTASHCCFLKGSLSLAKHKHNLNCNPG